MAEELSNNPLRTPIKGQRAQCLNERVTRFDEPYHLRVRSGLCVDQVECKGAGGVLEELPIGGAGHVSESPRV